MSSKTDEFIKKIREAADSLTSKTNIFQHYKGGIYQVTGYAINSDTTGIDVIYHRIDGPEYNACKEEFIKFTRPIDEFFDMVFVDTHPGFTPDLVQRFIPVKRNTSVTYERI